MEQVKKAGAKEVHFRSCSPMIQYPCYYGIDTPDRKNLIGANADSEYIRKEIGADSLGYLSIQGLIQALGGRNQFCLACFNGVYPVCVFIRETENNLENTELCTATRK